MPKGLLARGKGLITDVLDEELPGADQAHQKNRDQPRHPGDCRDLRIDELQEDEAGLDLEERVGAHGSTPVKLGSFVPETGTAIS